mmetsp:Transcript_25977/g.60718  ORF Transcript_25977/g.60718 Transcript_25977/m.60718 type:complete len:210 (+) Transcript_25977:50-679(+)
MTLVARQLHVADVAVYKVVAGSDDSLRVYNDMQMASYAASVVPTQCLDWRALYTQFQRKHVLGTVPYRWDKDFQEAQLISATFASLDVVVLEGKMLHDGALSGQEKALAVKRILDLPLEIPLMEALGAKGKVALVKETEDEWELIVPHELLSRLSFEEQVVARFKKHSVLPVTHRWRLEASTEWEPWVEDEACDSVPDADTTWMMTADS